MSLACRCAATVKRGSSPIAAHVWRSRLTPLYTAVPKSSARAGKPATVPRTVMQAVQIEETATILRFVVMFASGEGFAALFAAGNATDWGFLDVRNRAYRCDHTAGSLCRLRWRRRTH